MNGVILTAGSVDPSLVPLFGVVPSGMVPVNGKPIVCHIIESLIDASVERIFIAVGKNSAYLQQIVSAFFAKKIPIIFVDVDESAGPGNSVVTVLREIGQGACLVNLGDTIATASEDIRGRNCVVVSDDIVSSDEWCLVQTDESNRIIGFLDKQPNEELRNCAVGVYSIADASIWREVDEVSHRLEISDVLEHVIAKYTFETVSAATWHDFGHIDRYHTAKQQMLRGRYFNELSVDQLLGTLTKRSREREKFVSEVQWQMTLPARLAVLFPRLVDTDLYCDEPAATMEYYGYQALAEIWLYSSFGPSVFCGILQKALKLLNLFREYPTPVSRSSYDAVYVAKTDSRIEQLRADRFFDSLLERDEVTINGRLYPNWPSIRTRVFEKTKLLYNQEFNSVMHGDFCFSNILYDVSGGIIRLIDPRGDWGGGAGGDIRYDVAKLRHSACGLYDFIVADLFIADSNDGCINYEIFSHDHHQVIGAMFDQLAGEEYQLDEIKLIEGLLFLSMIPLHRDSHKRQTVMYCRALELLNSVL